MRTKINSAVVVIHEDPNGPSGPGHDLKNFLLAQGVKELLFIAHPLTFLKKGFTKSSRFEIYKKGKLITANNTKVLALPEVILFIKDFIYTFIWAFKIPGKVDYFFGLDNLNAFTGLVLKVFGKVNISIYYVMDFIPNRFSNKLLNAVYHLIDKICAQYSNYSWNLSPRMIEARSKKWRKNFPNQKVVYHGVHFKRIKRVRFDRKNKFEIIYMGVLLKKQGVQLILMALPKVIQKLPQVTFTIIGTGPFETELKRIVSKLRIKKHVKFLGFIQSHNEVENRLANASIAVAIYTNSEDNFTYYADPGKVKNYLAAGVPVLITDIPYIANVIAGKKCGIIVSNNTLDIADKLIKLLSSNNKLKQYSKNAVNFARQYDWQNIFKNALYPPSTSSASHTIKKTTI